MALVTVVVKLAVPSPANPMCQLFSVYRQDVHMSWIVKLRWFSSLLWSFALYTSDISYVAKIALILFGVWWVRPGASKSTTMVP